MSSSRECRPNFVRQALLAVVAAGCIAGCAKRDGDKPGAQQVDPGPSNDVHAELPSTDFLLSLRDVERFQPGSTKADILDDIQWRGNFEAASEHNGHVVCAICFGVFGGPSSPAGDVVWAIFIDDKFEKFVRLPQWGAKPIKVGDFGRLIRAVESEPIKISDLEKEAKARPTTLPDPAVTAAWLPAREGIQARYEEAYQKNAALRDRYNATRLRIGMTEAEVEAALGGAKPIDSGNVEAGLFKVFGGVEAMDVLPYLHYSNILVVFTNDKLIGIYSGGFVPGGQDGLRQLRELFLDLPTDPRGK